MKNSTMLRLQLNEAFDWLDQVIADLTPEQYSWQPEGSANPISKLHAHTLSSADFWMNLMGLQKPMLWMGVSQRLGLPGNFIEVWKTDAPINLSDMQEYAKDLREASLAIDALDDAALERELTAPVFGKRDVGFVLRLAAMQMAIHTGEISAAKGMQGLQGLPF
ncbi:MAG TPA: DinB family protein [Dehalococcoidia bacterium]|nr:DinB family protein [Dehalococcoidia bacterium]